MSARYPNVPDAPGVPRVFRLDGRPPTPSVQPLAGDALGGVQPARVTWGIFTRGGALALEADSVVVVEPTREFRISDYPTEEGGFRSYNKVATPAVERVTLTKGGDVQTRTQFLQRVEAMLESLDLYTVVTPEASYPNRNLVRRDMRRSAEEGATLVKVELEMMEVRVSAASAFTSANAAVDPGTAPRSVSGANRVNAGPVQPVTPTLDQLLDAEQARTPT